MNPFLVDFYDEINDNDNNNKNKIKILVKYKKNLKEIEDNRFFFPYNIYLTSLFKS